MNRKTLPTPGRSNFMRSCGLSPRWSSHSELHHERLARQLGARLAVFLCGTWFDYPGAGPARVIGGNPDEFSLPGKSGRAGMVEKYEVFRVEWSVEGYLGTSVWIDDGSTPTPIKIWTITNGEEAQIVWAWKSSGGFQNTVLIGTVSQVQGKRYKVTAGGITTDWLRCGGTRSGALRMWSPLTVGEQVVVLPPSGDLVQGVIMGSIESGAFRNLAEYSNAQRSAERRRHGRAASVHFIKGEADFPHENRPFL